ncbi:hypothetical protein J2046_005668 [Rhizobium petrolearium]|nr:hypothetical protein [Neorhizobium petrolearium]
MLGYDLGENTFQQSQIVGIEMNIRRQTAAHPMLALSKTLGKVRIAWRMTDRTT